MKQCNFRYHIKRKVYLEIGHVLKLEHLRGLPRTRVHPKGSSMRTLGDHVPHFHPWGMYGILVWVHWMRFQKQGVGTSSYSYRRHNTPTPTMVYTTHGKSYIIHESFIIVSNTKGRRFSFFYPSSTGEVLVLLHSLNRIYHRFRRVTDNTSQDWWNRKYRKLRRYMNLNYKEFTQQ